MPVAEFKTEMINQYENVIPDSYWKQNNELKFFCAYNIISGVLQQGSEESWCQETESIVKDY